MNQDNALDDCWNRIGVRGDHSCERLGTSGHCRNCDVYAQAAQQNLQRPLDEASRQEWAAQLRQPLAASARTDRAAIVFRIGLEWLALPANLIDAVAPEAPLHRVPHRTALGLLGLVNVNGVLRPAVSLAAILGLDGSAPPALTHHVFARLLLVQWEAQVYALPVAELHGIVHYASASLVAPAATVGTGAQRYVATVLELDGMRIGCLDAELLGRQLAECLL